MNVGLDANAIRKSFLTEATDLVELRVSVAVSASNAK